MDERKTKYLLERSLATLQTLKYKLLAKGAPIEGLNVQIVLAGAKISEWEEDTKKQNAKDLKIFYEQKAATCRDLNANDAWIEKAKNAKCFGDYLPTLESYVASLKKVLFHEGSISMPKEILNERALSIAHGSEIGLFEAVFEDETDEYNPHRFEVSFVLKPDTSVDDFLKSFQIRFFNWRVETAPGEDMLKCALSCYAKESVLYHFVMITRFIYSGLKPEEIELANALGLLPQAV